MMFRRKIIHFLSDFEQHLMSIGHQQSASQRAEKRKHDMVFAQRDAKQDMT